MQGGQPEHTDALPPQVAPQRMGRITIRFIGLLLLTVTVMALLWSR